MACPRALQRVCCAHVAVVHRRRAAVTRCATSGAAGGGGVARADETPAIPPGALPRPPPARPRRRDRPLFGLPAAAQALLNLRRGPLLQHPCDDETAALAELRAAPAAALSAALCAAVPVDAGGGYSAPYVVVLLEAAARGGAPRPLHALLDLLCRRRLPELSVPARAALVVGVHHVGVGQWRAPTAPPLAPHFARAVAAVLLGTRGAELSRLKDAVNVCGGGGAGAGVDLHTLLFRDLAPLGLRTTVLQHFAAEAALLLARGPPASPPPPRLRVVVTDFDDTVQPGWLDERWPTGRAYPGAVAFLSELVGAPPPPLPLLLPPPAPATAAALRASGGAAVAVTRCSAGDDSEFAPDVLPGWWLALWGGPQAAAWSARADASPLVVIDDDVDAGSSTAAVIGETVAVASASPWAPLGWGDGGDGGDGGGGAVMDSAQDGPVERPPPAALPPLRWGRRMRQWLASRGSTAAAWAASPWRRAWRNALAQRRTAALAAEAVRTASARGGAAPLPPLPTLPPLPPPPASAPPAAAVAARRRSVPSSLVVVTARPAGYRGAARRRTAAAMAAALAGTPASPALDERAPPPPPPPPPPAHVVVLLGSLLRSASTASIVARKAENVAAVRAVWPEAVLVCVGDAGQGDASVAAMTLALAVPAVAPAHAFIHDVTPGDARTGDGGAKAAYARHDGIEFFGTYAGAATSAWRRGVLPQASAVRVTGAAVAEVLRRSAADAAAAGASVDGSGRAASQVRSSGVGGSSSGGGLRAFAVVLRRDVAALAAAVAADAASPRGVVPLLAEWEAALATVL